MALRDMEYDRPGLEQGEVAFFIGRNLPKGMKQTMRGFLHLSERNKTNLVRLAHFFERPANAHVTRQSPAAIGRPFKRGNGRGHWRAPGDCMRRSMNTMTPTSTMRTGHSPPRLAGSYDERTAADSTCSYIYALASGGAVQARGCKSQHLEITVIGSAAG